MIVHVRPWLELLYFVAGIVVAPAVIYGLQQVKLLKRDIRIRNERASKERAIEFASRYLNVYVKLDASFVRDRMAENLPTYDGKAGNFTSSSIDQRLLSTSRKRYGIMSWLPAMNELETISAAFVTGVADEATGFGIIGRTFCSAVRQDYDLICLSRKEVVATHDYWRNIVELYKIWSPRLQGSELRDVRDRIDAKIASSGTERTIKPIGA